MTHSLTSGQRLATNVLWSFLAQGVPLLVAIVSIPLLIHRLGPERFGVLVLAWMLIGYFNLFDLGLGRALTKLVAERLGERREDTVSLLVWTALGLAAVLGAVGAVLLGILSPWLIRRVILVPEMLQAEALAAFYLLAVGLPFVTCTIGLRGVLEAYQRFPLLAGLGLPLSIWSYAGPLVAVALGGSLPWVVAALLAGRIAGFLAYLIVCLRSVPSLRPVRFHRESVGALLSFGGWMTVSNVIGPVMVYMDRFLIGAILGVGAVAYYATPYEVVTRLWLIPGAILGVLFPALATELASNRARAGRLVERGASYVFLLVFPAVVPLIVLPHELLSLWLGPSFAAESAEVLRWLALGVLVNSVAHVATGFIQADGRPDVTAKLHVAELPVYLVILWWLLARYGITGAAIAWTLRVAVDALALYWIALGRIPEGGRAMRRFGSAFVVAMAALAISALPSAPAARLGFAVITIAGFGVIGWRVILGRPERLWVAERLRLLSDRAAKA